MFHVNKLGHVLYNCVTCELRYNMSHASSDIIGCLGLRQTVPSGNVTAEFLCNLTVVAVLTVAEPQEDELELTSYAI